MNIDQSQRNVRILSNNGLTDVTFKRSADRPPLPLIIPHPSHLLMDTIKKWDLVMIRYDFKIRK